MAKSKSCGAISSAQLRTAASIKSAANDTINRIPRAINVKNALSRFHSALVIAARMPCDRGAVSCHNRSKANSICEKMPIAPNRNVTRPIKPPDGARVLTSDKMLCTSSLNSGAVRSDNTCNSSTRAFSALSENRSAKPSAEISTRTSGKNEKAA